MSLSRVRKLLIVYLALLVPIGWLATKYQPFLLDGDAVSYMDIADLLHARHWAGAINGYWHPLYPAFLAAAQILFHPTRWNEIPAYNFANYIIFLLELVAMVLFVYALDRLRARTPLDNPPLLSREALALFGAALIVISAQRELAIGLVRPDALLQALMLLAFAMLLNALATESLVYAPLMGLFFGLAYLTKSFAFVVALLAIAVMVIFRLWPRRWRQPRALTHVVANAALSLIVFGVVAGPYMAALSHQKHRFDFGDSGALNYAWYAGGVEKMHLEPWMKSSFGHATVHLIHPEQQLLASPGIYSYRAEPYGTYPDWFDTTFFNERITPHLNAPVLIRRDARNAVLVVRYLFNHPEAWILLILLLVFGARIRLVSWRPQFRVQANFWLPMILLGLAMWILYALVNVEERYVTLAYLVLVLPIFAALRTHTPEADEFGTTPSAWLPSAATAMIALLAFLAAGESLRLTLQQRRYETSLPHPWYNAEMFGAAHALQQLGVRPGDEVACMGASACLDQNYWARLAGVRILTEIYNPNGNLFRQWAGLPNRAQVLDILRGQNAKVLVAQFDPGAFDPASPAAQGWIRLDDTTLYALPLTLRDTLGAGAHTTSSTPATLPWNITRQGGP